jgi:hypothetical protein
MLLCKNCHLNGGDTSQCGADCFECHSEEAISRDILEHQVIDDCRNCHLKKSIFEEKNFSPYQNGSLVEFLNF